MSPTWVQSSLSSTFSFVTSLVHMLGFTRVPGYSNGRRSFWILKESSALIPGPRGERWCGDSSSPVADIEQSLVFVSSGDRQSRMVAFFPSSGLYTHFPQNPWAGLWLNRRKEFVNESWSTSSSSLPSDIRRLAKEMQLQPSIEVILRQRPTFWRGGAERPLNTAGHLKPEHFMVDFMIKDGNCCTESGVTSAANRAEDLRADLLPLS
ncbi:uncharacterized protein [Paralichthys olivaceus]|uniref:uncharacterized protein isoform X5 n=1 Tax=Paralichthys olivaceus TaxID=8255 RepID=UPI003751D841